ncbi:hypothetical protein GCM10022286_10890 [Gryllotalpicola daejeonensis]|uniref:Uncharacterized protein n=1 Tax=Gryllotalpicola daejeonensis TaxID=993087 RepID=A0ABP7ZI19_9MICO
MPKPVPAFVVRTLVVLVLTALAALVLTFILGPTLLRNTAWWRDDNGGIAIVEVFVPTILLIWTLGVVAAHNENVKTYQNQRPTLSAAATAATILDELLPKDVRRVRCLRILVGVISWASATACGCLTVVVLTAIMWNWLRLTDGQFTAASLSWAATFLLATLGLVGGEDLVSLTARRRSLEAQLPGASAWGNFTMTTLKLYARLANPDSPTPPRRRTFLTLTERDLTVWVPSHGKFWKSVSIPRAQIIAGVSEDVGTIGTPGVILTVTTADGSERKVEIAPRTRLSPRSAREVAQKILADLGVPEPPPEM